jgi:hypothetical protein
VARAPVFLKWINFRDHLTALSWVGAWRLCHPGSPVRFAVIRVQAGDLGATTPSVLSTLLQASHLPKRPLVPRIAFFDRPGLSALVEWLGLKEEMSESAVWPTLPIIRSCIWEGLTSTREQHHSFSNVVGAFVLSASLKSANESPQTHPIEEYIIALIQSVGVNTGNSPVGCWIESTLQRRLGGAVLLDDMADLWGTFLCGALDLQEGKTFATTPSGSFFETIRGLPERLMDFLRDKKRHFLSAHEIIPSNRVIQDRFVLFLDLRLFPDAESTDPNDARHRFLRQLADFGITLLNSERHLPWLDEKGKARLRKELARFRERPPRSLAENSPGEALPPEETLLPRLLGLLDPTLPIVIFSSTHRSELIDPFRDFGNIITTFRKPILSEMTRDWRIVVKELQADFVTSMEQAARILAVRRNFSVTKRVTEEREETTEARAVEIFIDESCLPDASVYAVGALVLLAKRHGDIRNFCRELESRHLQWGLSVDNRQQLIKENREPRVNRTRLVCARTWSVIASPPGDYLHKRPDNRTKAWVARRISEIASRNGVVIAAAAVGCKITSSTAERLRLRSLQSVSLTQTDELHRELTVRLLQSLFLSHPSIRAAVSKRNSSIALDVAERTSAPEDYDARCENLFQNFGFRYTDQPWNDLSPRERCALWNQVISIFRNNGKLLDKPDNVSLDAAGNMSPDQATLEGWTNCKAWRLSKPRLMFSVASHDGLGFLRAALSTANPAVNPTIVRSRGVPLFDFDGVSSWMIKLDSFPCFPYQIHYLADWIALAGAIQIADPGTNAARVFEGFFRNGFIQEWTPEMRRLALAIARVENDDRAEGVAEMLAWIEENGPRAAEDSRLVQLMLRRGADASAMLQGTELRSLFSEIDPPVKEVGGGLPVAPQTLDSLNSPS